MEPTSREKLDALRAHVQTLNEQLEDLRLQYDLSEKKDGRCIIEKEIDRLVSVLDPLICDLLAMEEAGGETKHEWIGKLVTRGGDRVYRVCDMDEKVFYLEGMEYENFEWKQTWEMFALKKTFVWRLLTDEEIRYGFGCFISDEWIGRPIRNSDGRLCNLLGKEGGNYLAQLVVKDGKFIHEKVYITVSPKSLGWSLVGSKD
ncbi:hypothetical protein [Brazilian marseillevirus]|uniref:hypothetical protein n=1 Tax=Brazilian marseillevirus TaxID=1813599 RepID=UPI000780AE89|nr:hypothetical protein A3303_gp154 [Brazilian marseillevirus]AMQ10662.1 hypothetical protein [Brazilian marseillevirus]